MSARRFSGPPAATVAIKLDAARPRANSEPGAKYGAIGFSPDGRVIARALCVQNNTFFNRGLAEKSWLLPLVESPLIPSPIPEEPEQLCEKVQDPIVTDKGELECLACAQELPPQLGTEFARRFWDFFSLYRLIFAFTILANLAAITLATPFSSITSSDAATGAAINLCLAVLVRNEHVVNAMFRSVCTLKPSTPLSVRRVGAKVYSYGGFHSGCATAGMLWYLAFTDLLSADLSDPHKRSAFAFALFISVLLLAISWSAFPAFRVSYHNTFEAVHRYAGWFSVGLLWAQLGTSVAISCYLYGESASLLLIESPLFWYVKKCHHLPGWKPRSFTAIAMQHNIHFNACVH